MNTADCLDKFVKDLHFGDMLVSFCSYVIECKKINTDEYMQGLVEEINKVAMEINDSNIFMYDEKIGIIVKVQK